MTPQVRQHPRLYVTGIAMVAAFAATAVLSAGRGLVLVAEYKVPAIESEISGIYADPAAPDFFYAAANKQPAYRNGQRATLPTQYRGKLLRIDGRTGVVESAIDLANGNYGGLAYGDARLFVSSLEPPEIVAVDLGRRKVTSRVPVSGPIGGLEYDVAAKKLIGQMYQGYPHLAVIEPRTGATVKTLWSDESAMDLKKVGRDLLCTWVSGFDAAAFSELRLIDESTGRVNGRIRLDAVHTSMAAAPDASGPGFLSMVSVDRTAGSVVVRRYRYAADAMAWLR